MGKNGERTQTTRHNAGGIPQGFTLQFIKELLADVTGQLKAMSQNYVTKADLTELKKEKEEVHREFERRIRLLEDQASKLQAYGTIALVLLGLLQFGITLFVNKIL